MFPKKVPEVSESGRGASPTCSGPFLTHDGQKSLKKQYYEILLSNPYKDLSLLSPHAIDGLIKHAPFANLIFCYINLLPSLHDMYVMPSAPGNHSHTDPPKRHWTEIGMRTVSLFTSLPYPSC